MYYQNTPQGTPARSKFTKKETPVNKLEFTGIIRPRGLDKQEVTITETSTGKASAKFQLECIEYMGINDEAGNPKMSRTYVPVSVWSNKTINVAMLRSLVPGMKVHVVGRWTNQHFKGRNGEDVRMTECTAYVVEILEQVQPQYPGYQPAAAPYGQPVAQPQYPTYQQPAAPMPQYPNYQQPAAPAPTPYEQPSGQPRYPASQQPAAPAPYGQPIAQPQYPIYQQPNTPAPGTQQAEQQNIRKTQPIPPYYKQPASPAPAPAPASGIPGIPAGTIEV